MNSPYQRIVTHDDFDGAASAALCVAVHDIDLVDFTGPNVVSRQGYPVTREDIVCDLPYPGECGLWFDHHEGNLKEIVQRGLKPENLPGRFAQEKSCARVIYEFYRGEYEFPLFYEETVAEVDRVDSFDYASVAEWRRETPSRIINDALKSKFHSRDEEEAFLRTLIGLLTEQPLSKIAADEGVAHRYQSYLRDEEKMISIIREASYFHPAGNPEYVIIDLTRYPKQMFVVRNLAQIIYPGITGVFLVQNLYEDGIKTTHFKISGSLTIKTNGFKKDIGDIMRSLNIGDGHAGAGSGQVNCESKTEMEKRKIEILDRVHQLWSAQKSADLHPPKL